VFNFIEESDDEDETYDSFINESLDCSTCSENSHREKNYRNYIGKFDNNN